jgi:hypothetical protein
MLIKRNFLLIHKNDSDFTLCRRGTDLWRLASGTEPAVTAARLLEGSLGANAVAVGGDGRFVKFGTRREEIRIE